MNDAPDKRVPEAVPRCAFHPNVPAVARCVRCGRFVCGYCREWVQGKNYCPQCLGPYAFSPWPEAPQAPPRPAPRVKPGFPEVNWSLLEAFLVFIISLSCTVPVTLILYFSIRYADISSLGRSVLLVFSSSCTFYALLIFGTYFSVAVRNKNGTASVGLVSRSSLANLGWGALISIPLLIGALGLGYISQLILGPETQDAISRPLSEVAGGNGDIVYIILLIVTLVVLAPICEEIYFRGYLYPALRNKLGKQPGLLINAVFFAFVHFELVGFLPRALLGYGLAYLYEKRRSMVGPIIAHALYNGAVFLLAFFFNFW